jgi:hypothetical protein
MVYYGWRWFSTLKLKSFSVLTRIVTFIFCLSLFLANIWTTDIECRKRDLSGTIKSGVGVGLWHVFVGIAPYGPMLEFTNCLNLHDNWKVEVKKAFVRFPSHWAGRQKHMGYADTCFPAHCLESSLHNGDSPQNNLSILISEALVSIYFSISSPWNNHPQLVFSHKPQHVCQVAISGCHSWDFPFI